MFKPYIDEKDNLIIPFNCDPKYHWWKQENEVQALNGILQELGRLDVAEKYIFDSTKVNQNNKKGLNNG